MDIILNSFVAFYYMYHLAIEEPISERLSKLESPTPALQKLLPSYQESDRKKVEGEHYNHYKKYEENDDLPPRKFGDHDPFPLDPETDSDRGTLHPQLRNSSTLSVNKSRVRSELEIKIAQGIRNRMASFR